MAASSTLAINSSVLECSFCLSVFVDPRLLPCGHTFCLTCIKGQIAGDWQAGKSTCALCRQAFTIPDNDVYKLPKNYTLVAVTLEAREASPPSTAATAAAPGPSAAPAAVAAVDPKLMCKKHTDQKLVVYCKDCKTMACAVCGLTSHSKHTCLELNEANKEFKETIAKAVADGWKAIDDQKLKIKELEANVEVEKATLEAKILHVNELTNSDTLDVFERQALISTLPPPQTNAATDSLV